MGAGRSQLGTAAVAMRPALLAVLLVPVALLLAASSGDRSDPEPSPSLSPEEVVRIQVEALRQNDEPYDDAGIEAAFRFASPSNRRATGPLPRFAEMIRRGYADMLGFERAEYGPMRVEGDRASQWVTLVQPDGLRTEYVFGLSRQEGGACDGCWMTDAVIRPPETSGDGYRKV